MATQTNLSPEYTRATVPIRLDNSVEQHLGEAQQAVDAAQKSPITLDELQSIKAIAEEQIRRSDEALARLSHRAEKLKESRASLLQKADKNILDIRSPQPQLVQPSPPVARIPTIQSPPASKAAAYLRASPATVEDRTPKQPIINSIVLNASSVPVSSYDEELAGFGALGERLSQTFAKMELLGQETSKPRGIPGKQVSPDISLAEDLSSIQKEREELQRRYRNVVESKLFGAPSLPNSARGSGSGSGSISSFHHAQMTPIVPVASARPSSQSRWNVDVEPSMNASMHPTTFSRQPIQPNSNQSELEPRLPQYQQISNASATTWAQVNQSVIPTADMPGRATQPSPLQPPSPQTQEQFRQATAMLKESFTEAKVDRNTLAVMRNSKVSPGVDAVDLVGLHVPLELGLRVKPVDPSLEYTNGGAGIVTKVHEEGNACFVKWDASGEECGWYKCGVRGYYALKLIPKEEEGPMLPDNVVRTGGNGKADVEERRSQYDEENMFSADNVLLGIGDFLGSW